MNQCAKKTTLVNQVVYDYPSACKGITLIELLIAMTLGLLLLSIMLGIYLAMQKSHHLQTAINNIQDNARVAISLLSADIRKAGNIGCAKLTKDFLLTSHTPYTLSTQNKLTGAHTGNSASITIRHASFPSAALVEPMQDDSILYVTRIPKFKVGDILLIADCKQAEIFKVEYVAFMHGLQKIIPQTALHQHYEAHAEVSQLEINHYFVDKTSRHDTTGAPIFSLWKQDLNTKSELVEGVYRMQIRYAIEQQGSLIEVAASNVQDWSKILGVAIELEMGAGPIRKIWHAYIALRDD